MRLTADTNVLIRVLTRDDEAQALAAETVLLKADLVALTLPALCEVCWVLSTRYRHSRAEIAEAIRALVSANNVEISRSAVEAGLDHLDAGGDFADGVIAHDGLRLGALEFLSFDRGAVELVRRQGLEARLLP